MISTVHPQSLIEHGTKIGTGSTIGAFTHVLAKAVIGKNCLIGDHVFIDDEVTLGDGVAIKSGVKLWKGIHIADRVFIGSNASFANDFTGSLPFPADSRSNEIILETGCVIGANATILTGLKIGQGAVVAAGSVVTHSVPPNAIVSGNPAQITGYVAGANTARLGAGSNVDRSIRLRTTSKNVLPQPAVQESAVKRVFLQRFGLIQDLRGDLTVGEFARNIPFTPKRYFLVFNVQNREIRGEHAHRKCEQFLVCIAGACHIVVDDGFNREEFVLDDPTLGLYIPAMTWATQYKYSDDGVLLVFASEYYEPADYIRDYTEFLVKSKNPDL